MSNNVGLTGRAICQGLAIGQAFLHRENIETLADSYWIQADEVEEQLRRIERATKAVAASYENVRDRVPSGKIMKEVPPLRIALVARSIAGRLCSRLPRSIPRD